MLEILLYGYLHLATHRHANAVSGLSSYLAQANDHLPDTLTLPPPGEKLYDGRLTAAQMQRWNLAADLTGARSVVLSESKVDDTATSLLMQRFYQNLLGKRPGLEHLSTRCAGEISNIGAGHHRAERRRGTRSVSQRLRKTGTSHD